MELDIILPVMQIRRLRTSEIKQLAQGSQLISVRCRI